MPRDLFIGGDWTAPVLGGRIEVVDPATEETFDHIGAASAVDVDRAVRAAHAAFNKGPWPRLTGAERARYLKTMATGIVARRDELAIIEVRDNGKPLAEARCDIDDAATCLRYYADLAEAEDRRVENVGQPADPNYSLRVVREPIGVVGAITPWNYPLLMSIWKVAPALAAGCAVILKPSELASLTSLELGLIAEAAGLPPGVLNIVTGYGADAGQALIEHPLVDKLAFTGSVTTGRKVAAAAVQDIKRISLELGGKSPFVVFADSDIDKAVEWIMFGIFLNQGQICSATSRVLVEESLYDRLVERLAEEAGRIVIGNGLDEGTQLGPLISRGQYDKVIAAIERGKAEGSRLAAGGKRPLGFARGYFVEPTVFADVSADSYLWREEIFGPVVCVKSFTTEEEAIELANDSRFGLAAAVMSKNQARAERVARAFRAGIVWINCSQATFIDAPWGGYKQSGIGRELGRWGFEAYLEVKQIAANISDTPCGWYRR
ncbi:aldehyde dehydrogenase [Rhodoblastus sphagnicola]|uniref:Aldehyde dehydrogenase n=1 Tax=Rhodoblastus sphagnicola TaxID=333368 RepID=A0A2S6NGV7_9HYPH|nr:aldehyde dehydrogenase family protein [Rhodoblastus sphagnicola]MBB4201007.1 betaine-aldehyde dehydrogenase [Rhodoblastus sphagnicola]PPQ33837.1 aldehyde dehydrogenase [Rhodoblastus sphagnicola]